MHEFQILLYPLVPYRECTRAFYGGVMHAQPSFRVIFGAIWLLRTLMAKYNLFSALFVALKASLMAAINLALSSRRPFSADNILVASNSTYLSCLHKRRSHLNIWIYFRQ